MPERDESLSESLAQNTSRRGFLARVSRVLFAASATGTVGAVLKTGGDVDAHHLCGHTYTTGSCPHPHTLGISPVSHRSKPRVDAHGYPLRASDGHPIDNIGRPINSQGVPLDGSGDPLLDADGKPLPPAPRTTVCAETGKRLGFHTQLDGSWYRCCGGHVRKLWDCCAKHSTRINGDAALVGYCYAGRKVFCVTYFDTSTPC
ncbi:MAG: hypothetical protein QOG26_181 [Solirubrobacterales bacterium]|nr:hypothetical protein [Solirubrobacterales bacterium]MDX6652991.1 hypothetical protein [Solirubrobacterales bacterium]